jgi:hypothetical protein
MNTNLPSENDGSLRGVLREWTVDAPLPPRFQEQVWQRIARKEVSAEPGFWQVLVRGLEAGFRRPALAFSYVAVLLMVGLTTGYWQALDRTAHARAEWRAQYVQSVDPYQNPRD